MTEHGSGGELDELCIYVRGGRNFAHRVGLLTLLLLIPIALLATRPIAHSHWEAYVDELFTLLSNS